MRLVTYEHDGRTGVGIAGDGGVAPTAFDDMAALIRDGAIPEPTGDPFDPDRLLVPVRPSKVLCCGINYRAHGEEAAEAREGHSRIRTSSPSCRPRWRARVTRSSSRSPTQRSTGRSSSPS